MSKSRSKYIPGKTATTKKGSGDYYGSGIRQKVGKMRDIGPVTPSKLKIPPRSLA